MDITNKTKKPLSVPLPGGKKLFLQPGKTGQVNAKALTHPALAKLIEAGDLESADARHGPSKARADKSASPSTGSGGAKGGGGAARQSGDR